MFFLIFHIFWWGFRHMLYIFLRFLKYFGDFWCIRALASTRACRFLALARAGCVSARPGRVLTSPGTTRVDPDIGSSLVSFGRDLDAPERGRDDPRSKTGMHEMTLRAAYAPQITNIRRKSPKYVNIHRKPFKNMSKQITKQKNRKAKTR